MIKSVETDYTARWERHTEYIIAVTELVLAILLLALYHGAVKPVDVVEGEALTATALIAFPLICLARLAYVRLSKPSVVFQWASPLLDIAFLTIVVMSFATQYGVAAATIKAPTFVFYFVLIALHAMRFNPWQVIVSGCATVACWIAILATIASDATTTHSYLEYVSSPAILFGAEIEKLFGLFAFAMILAIGVWRAKAVLQDAVSKKMAEAEMFKAVEASRAKSEFLANMSHEIRTPMNGLLGIGDLLERTPLDDQQKEYVRILRNSGDALLGVINDILDISKIEAGKLELSAHPFDLRELVEDVAETHASGAAKKGLELVASSNLEDESFVLGDRSRLRQVLSNLIGNAVKFTDNGHVIVELNTQKNTTDQTISSTIVVKDTGVGISKDHLERIFDKFEQADNSVTRKYGGTGLGLAISKNLIDEMGGNIQVTSNYGAGACFTISLTLPIPQRAADSGETNASVVCLKGKRALVIDDLPVNLRIIKDMLSSWEMEAITTVSPVKGVELAKSNAAQFDAILMDYHMPELDGVSASKQISEALGEDCPPILLLTSMDEFANATKLVGSGVASAIIKPIRANKLRDLLAGKVREKKTSPIDEGNVIDQQPEEANKALRILLAEDNEVNRMVLTHMLSELKPDLTIAEDGQYAIEHFNSDIPFDMVLMDISMPRLDGLSATKIIRQLELEKGLGHTPVIGITAHATQEDWNEALASGMDDCLTKPVKQEKLMQAIETYLGQGAKDVATA